MAQHDYDIANGSGSTVRADINSLGSALRSQNSGTTAPTATAAGMTWYDTTNNAMKQRNSGNSAWVSQAEAIAGGHLAGMRNRIINGNMQIDQRNAGATQTITAGAALAYTVDRWYAYCTGANITGARFQAASIAPYRYRFTGAASNTGVGFGQRIESWNSRDLAGKTCTLSATLSSSSLTTITWTAYYANTTDTFGTLASPTRTQIATGTFSITSSDISYNAQISVPAAATTGIEIVFTGGALLGSQTLAITDVQFEPGGVATPFETRFVQQEIINCFRTFWRVSGSLITVGQAVARSSARATLFVNLPCPMRATPTASYTDIVAVGVVGTVANVTGSSPEYVYPGQNQIALGLTLNTTTGDHAFFVYTSGTGGSFQLSAEL